MKYCTNPACKTALPDFVRSCTKCGQQLNETQPNATPPRASGAPDQVKPQAAPVAAATPSTQSGKKKGLIFGGVAVGALVIILAITRPWVTNPFPFLGIVYAHNCYVPNDTPIIFLANGQSVDLMTSSDDGGVAVTNYDGIEVQDGGGGQKMIFITSSSNKKFIRAFADANVFDVTEIVKDGKTTYKSGKSGTGYVLKACQKNSAATTFLKSLSPKIVEALQ